MGPLAEVEGHLCAKSARALDLAGETIIPGITDAHLHLLFYAKQRTGVSLNGTASLIEALELLKKTASSTEEGDWIQGVRYNSTYWIENRPPTRQDLDATGIDRPILLTRVCTHVHVANSIALSAAGIPQEIWGNGIFLETDVDPVIKAWRTG